MYRLILILAVFWAVPAVADDIAVIEQRLQNFVKKFDKTAFGDIVNLIRPNTIHTWIHFNLDVEIDPKFDKPGKYYPPNARYCGGLCGTYFRNSLLKV
ncbi:MAG: hypothetical protein JO163_08925, partial [Methylobacteriaceae bacterium]|nr:hypothetical protein [Methylobacteriaceae bacterium]